MPPAFRRLRRSIERLVGSDVHTGEWYLVLLFFANLFLLLTAYYILKVIREPLILMAGGGSEDPREFSEDIFSTRRITIAPMCMVAGFITIIVAIMKKPKQEE